MCKKILPLRIGQIMLYSVWVMTLITLSALHKTGWESMTLIMSVLNFRTMINIIGTVCTSNIFIQGGQTWLKRWDITIFFLYHLMNVGYHKQYFNIRCHNSDLILHASILHIHHKASNIAQPNPLTHKTISQVQPAFTSSLFWTPSTYMKSGHPLFCSETLALCF